MQKLRGRINVAALTHQAMAIGKFDGWPEVSDERGRGGGAKRDFCAFVCPVCVPFRVYLSQRMQITKIMPLKGQERSILFF